MGQPSKFCLTHKDDEITEVSTYLGILEDLEKTIDIVDEHDELNNLKEERKDGGIANWEERTLSLEVPFLTLQDTIFDNVMSNLMAETSSLPFSGSKADKEYLFANAFIEGMIGTLTLGSTDLDDLSLGKSILAKYQKAA
jgi:hypothetical protein